MTPRDLPWLELQTDARLFGYVSIPKGFRKIRVFRIVVFLDKICVF